MKHIQSRDNPFFKQLCKLSDSARQRHQAGHTLLDGAHLLAACLDAGGLPQHLLLNAAGLRDAEIAALLTRCPGVPQTVLDDALFGALTELKTKSGVLALMSIPAPQPMVPPDFCVLLEQVQDPGNLGSILRSAAAAGCDAALLSPGCADVWSPKVLRAAMGGHFSLAIYTGVNLPEFASQFAGRVWAAALGATTSLYQCDWRGRVALAIGNEGAGLSAGLQQAATPFHIPMPGRVESLNAAAAAAVALFEAVRQRQ